MRDTKVQQARRTCPACGAEHLQLMLDFTESPFWCPKTGVNLDPEDARAYFLLPSDLVQEALDLLTEWDVWMAKRMRANRSWDRCEMTLDQYTRLLDIGTRIAESAQIGVVIRTYEICLEEHLGNA